MKFKDMHPDYKNYTSETHTFEFPRSFFDTLQGIIVRGADESESPQGSLKYACDIIAKHIPTRLTTNSGYSWLVGDLDDYVGKLKNKSLSRILDTISGSKGTDRDW